jgi:glycerophosphoryl diester phosphodiesterase
MRAVDDVAEHRSGSTGLALEPPVAFAHRGGAGSWPENTSAAFAGCLRLGDFVIETDARVSRDQQLVLSHDEHLERTTNGHGEIADHTLEELRCLDAGYWFGDGSHFPHRGTGLSILSLSEALQSFPDARFNIELKPGCRTAPRLMWNLLKERDATHRCLIASADHDLITEFRRLSAGTVTTSASRREIAEFALRVRLGALSGFRPSYRALQIPIRAYGVDLVTSQLLQAAHGLGVQVHVWTINSSDSMQALLESGADGIMTDLPELLARVLDEWRTDHRKSEV